MAIAFLLTFGALLLNLASAGVAALLAIRARETSRRRRTAWACIGTGVVTALMLGGILLEQNLASRGAGVVSLSLAVIIVLGAVVSLPGAIIASRMGERGLHIGNTFD